MSANTTDLSKTMRLPQTSFGMRANLQQNEPTWVNRWLQEDVYGTMRSTRQAANAAGQGAGYYHVHLGPPYANGNFHMGHVLTYVLKDFVVRHKSMAGHDTPYTAGWDCHGLPIEWKVEQDLRQQGKTKHDITKKELRARCRAYARQWISVQMQDWQRLGCLADWEGHYETMAPTNEAGIVRELGKMVQRGLVTQKLRSTQWSWAEETALAEAEVEYADKQSEAIYLALPMTANPQEHVVIWTTTPWTLPANRAVAVDAAQTYTRITHNSHTFWVAAALQENFVQTMGWSQATINKTATGQQLIGQTYAQPLYGTPCPIIHAHHVTTESGTGLVHIAPAHGAEDFLAGQTEGLDLTCPVNGAGKYEPWVPPLADGTVLAGQLIWPMQKPILAHLEKRGLLLKQTTITHSYPVSWRSKEKLIFRSTPQWFVELDKPVAELQGQTLRQASLNRIYGRGVKGVEWLPGTGQNRIGSMIEGRPDWCISRQRAWGVPITIMVNTATGHLITDPAVWEHIATLVFQEGIDAWDDRLTEGRHAELFPAGWLQAQGMQTTDFTYVTDILDVWFDSGTTHAHVVRAESAPGQRFHRTDGRRPADLYQEGSDQHRGWFHSSLLTSVANYNDAPYETVLTSGFVVDGEGRKFSKSLGNGVEPKDVLKDFGMDIMRLWVAKSDYREDVRYSPALMQATAEDYRKFRNTLRWLLGNLHGYHGPAPAYQTLPDLEKYILHRWATTSAEVRAHANRFEFWKAYQQLYTFCSADLSNLYFDARKDVLYCDPDNSPTLHACQSVLHTLLQGLTTHLAPFMPFTADEAWRTMGHTSSVHLATYHITPVQEQPEFENHWHTLLAIREEANKALETMRAQGQIGGNIEASVTAPHATETLREILGVSHVHQGPTIQVSRHTGHKCARCWRYHAQLNTQNLCLRCEGAVKA